MGLFERVSGGGIGAIESALLPTSSLGFASSAAPVHVTISNRQEVLQKNSAFEQSLVDER